MIKIRKTINAQEPCQLWRILDFKKASQISFKKQKGSKQTKKQQQKKNKEKISNFSTTKESEPQNSEGTIIKTIQQDTNEQKKIIQNSFYLFCFNLFYFIITPLKFVLKKNKTNK
ncbi:hypothetical protein RFI_19171 [Reticulomyxa filosa]|uniref:Transmembrane protein n=1 Tax=Reticulomyxa filosa TaxID=46433 RepID=X6MVU3_RETFI|nr:hypothetical protein RFI_19171 [Reticulomyxa filosa]|eukprot:ETO18118.1 hypothetical protein RFI_19171 [Reticulomyxa filosa]